jgi:hypothetical protein
MIKRKKDKYGHWQYLLTLRNEKYQLVYNEYYSLAELAEMPECFIRKSTLAARLGNYTRWTLIEAMQTPEANGSSMADLNQVLKLMPVGSLASTVR